MLRLAAPVLAVTGTRAGEGHAVSDDALSPLGVDALPDKGVDALPDKGVDAPSDKGADFPPDKGVDAPPDKGSRNLPGKDPADVIKVARLLLALSSDVTTTDDEVMRAFSTGSSSFALTPVGVDALPDKGVDAPPDKGVDAPSDKGSRTSPDKDSAVAIRVVRLLLALSLDVTATDDEPMRAFSTGSSSFAIPNVSSATGPTLEMACLAPGVNCQGRVLHLSIAAVETGPNGRAPFSSTRALVGFVTG